MKGKVSWARDGDGNTKLFYSVMSARKAKIAIRRLEKEVGSLIKEEGLIIEEINGLYVHPFSASPVCTIEWEGVCWQPISSEHASELFRPFEEAEIKAGVFGCARGKLPGPDNFSVAFYLDFWEILKDDLSRVFTEFWNSSVINISTNETHLCLIPKKLNTNKVRDFRPINLVIRLLRSLRRC